jgi:class 3 adenylate cyclase
MTEFAFAMQSQLETINRDAFQTFTLRCGISYGTVVAGVIGARTPQYDIWGDTVNMAARMDTHGQPNRVHVRAHTLSYPPSPIAR